MCVCLKKHTISEDYLTCCQVTASLQSLPLKVEQRQNRYVAVSAHL